MAYAMGEATRPHVETTCSDTHRRKMTGGKEQAKKKIFEGKVLLFSWFFLTTSFTP